MMRSMMSGISGLRNHQTAMDVIGNNIANVNTSGFKASRVLFKEVFSSTMANATAPNSDTGMGGTDPMQVGMGSAVASIDMLYTEGNIERTDNPLDVSIDGNGLFIIKTGDSSSYTFTRSGAFGVDKMGNLVTSSGALVCGWQKKIESEDALEEDTFATTMDVEPINIYNDIYNGNKQIIEPEATTAVVLSGNLNANSEAGTSVGVPLTLYDNYGNEIQATMTLNKLENIAESNSLILNDVKNETLKDRGDNDIAWQEGMYVKQITETIGNQTTTYYQEVSEGTPGALKVIGSTDEYIANKWTYSISVNGNVVTDNDGDPVTGSIIFSNNPGEGYGKVQELLDKDGNEIEDFKLDFVAKYDASPDNKTSIYFDFSSVTQYASKDSIYVYDSNGYATGKLTEYSIGNDGVITGIYSNGKQQPLAVIALASFQNYTGLKSVGDSSYTATANSGDFKAVVPGDTAGSLSSNTLEMSNVDLSTEFTNMIIYQRGFQANSRGITTADEMLQELVNLKR